MRGVIALTTSSTLELRAPSQLCLEVRFAQAARTKRASDLAGRDIDSPSSKSTSPRTSVVREASYLHSQSRRTLDVEMARDVASALQLLERLLHRNAICQQYMAKSESAVAPARQSSNGQQANHNPARLRHSSRGRGIVARVVNGIHVRAITREQACL
jgi:hypothetical protein